MLPKVDTIAVLLCSQLYNVFGLCLFWLDYRPPPWDIDLLLAEFRQVEDWFRGTPRDSNRVSIPCRYFAPLLLSASSGV